MQAAFDRERSSENYFSGSFEITGNMKVLLVYYPTTACCQPYYGMVWNHSVTTKPRACVPHTPYALILRFASPAGRVCGVATHAVGRGAGYGLLADYTCLFRRNTLDARIINNTYLSDIVTILMFILSFLLVIWRDIWRMKITLVI